METGKLISKMQVDGKEEWMVEALQNKSINQARHINK